MERPSYKRLRRALVAPTAGLVLAFAAVLSLAGVSTEPVSRDRPRPPPPFLGKGAAPPADPPPAKAPPVQGPPARAFPARPAPAAPAPAVRAPAAPASLDQEVDRATDVLERLRVIDRSIGTVEASKVVATIERLLERAPGSPEEARSLRVALVGRLGVFRSDPRVVDRLIALTDPSLERSERLAAIEALGRDGQLPERARAPLERIGSTDRDAAVQRKARWALGLKN